MVSGKIYSLYRLKLYFICGIAFFLMGASMQSASRPPRTTVAPSPATHLDGAKLFHEKGCEYCHGVAAAGVTDKGPSLLTVGRLYKRKIIEQQIHDGGGGMPAFGDVLNADELASLVNFLAQKKKAPKGLPPTPPLTQKDGKLLR